MDDEININNKKYKGGKLTEAVISSLDPILKKLSEKGIKNVVNGFSSKIDIDKFILNKIKSQLSKHIIIELGNKYLDKLSVQYRYDGIQIEPFGILRLIVKKITITDIQILNSFESILSQIEDKYIKNRDYIYDKIDEIITILSKTEIYKPKNSEEKTLYDFAMFILLNYYDVNKEVPKWVNLAVDNIGKGEFLNSWIDILIDYISEVIAKVSENIFVNFKVTFDSFILRVILNKKTNKGQISSLIKILNIDVKNIIYKFAKSYISPSFIKGIGEIIANLVCIMLSQIDEKFLPEKDLKIDNLPFNITVCAGEDFTHDRSILWYTLKNFGDNFLLYSYDRDFKNYFKVLPVSKSVRRTFPKINLGLISGYEPMKLIKNFVTLKNLKFGTIYYKIVNSKGESTKIYELNLKKPTLKSEFLVFADSQGMVKQDYDDFSQVLNLAVSRENPDFIVHLGDFVDDGNNEEYWKWVLSSDIWKENSCVALAGNHEAIKSFLVDKFGLENPILAHFCIKNFPINQDTSKGIYYSFEYQNACFVVLNTNFPETGIDQIQYQYALDTFEKSKSKWKILFTHKCPYSNGPHAKDSDVKKLSNILEKLAYKANIDLVLGGHDHVYVRTHILACGKNVGCQSVLKHNFKDENIFVNPYGTIFVIPGTSGVKNYKQDSKINLPSEKILNYKGQIYSKIKFSESKLSFVAYGFDRKNTKFEIIDSFSIKKYDDKNIKVDSSYVYKLINSIPDFPPIDDNKKIQKILNLYESLSYQEKVKVKNANYLFDAIRLKKNYLEIIENEICTVKTKKEFLHALENTKVGTIISLCEELKINSKLIINRNLCIRGISKLSNVEFLVQKGKMLILGDNICINNTAKITSFSKSGNIFELCDDSCLIINDNVSVNSFSGLKKKCKAINVLGENASVYLNSFSCSFVKDIFLEAINPTSKIIVKSGKYISNGVTFVVGGSLKIKKGFVRSIHGLDNSNIKIKGGVIGEEKENKTLNIPIKTSGKIILQSGKIRSKDGVSILIYPSGEHILEKSDYSNAIDIKGKILYN